MAISVNDFWPDITFQAPKPSYLPDFSRCDIVFFPRLQNLIKGHHPKPLKFNRLAGVRIFALQYSCEDWENCIHWCVVSQGWHYDEDIEL